MKDVQSQQCLQPEQEVLKPPENQEVNQESVVDNDDESGFYRR